MSGPVGAAPTRGLFSTPNLISALRIPLAAAFPLLDGLVARLLVLVVAAASDWVDGRLARAKGRVTRIGALLDPVADKIFVATALVTLVLEGRLAWWAVLLILVRDIGVVVGGGLLALLGRPRRVAVRRAGKAVTWLQFAALGAILAWPPGGPWIAPVVAVAGLVALAEYGRASRPR